MSLSPNAAALRHRPHNLSCSLEFMTSTEAGECSKCVLHMSVRIAHECVCVREREVMCEVE
jgi:hypothetical protein